MKSILHSQQLNSVQKMDSFNHGPHQRQASLQSVLIETQNSHRPPYQFQKIDRFSHKAIPLREARLLSSDFKQVRLDSTLGRLRA